MSIPDLSPHALASLLAIAEHGSLSAAARARGLTQPSISRQIQDLERQLQVVLVERTSQGARLTPAGETLADGARWSWFRHYSGWLRARYGIGILPYSRSESQSHHSHDVSPATSIISDGENGRVVAEIKSFLSRFA